MEQGPKVPWVVWLWSAVPKFELCLCSSGLVELVEVVEVDWAARV